jgi:ABC-type amino acid transport substrate-binding protein
MLKNSIAFFLTTFFLLISSPGHAQSVAAPASDSTLTDTTIVEVTLPPRLILIGAKPSPPFLFKEDGQWTGISYQLWHLIAAQLNVNFSFKEMALPDILIGLQDSTIDLCINPLTVTSERIQKFGFTQPFYASRSAVAAKVKRSKSAWDYVSQFFSFTFLKVILFLFVILLIFGFAVWLFERKANPDEFSNNIKGLWSGLWWSAVTMTTVGYGDKSPRSFGGRMIGLIWMFTAIIIISSFTASITSALTLDQLDSDIEELDDLRGLKVGSVRKSASSTFLGHNSIGHREYSDISEGLRHVESGVLDAFVYDEPILRYYLEKLNLSEAKILQLKFHPQYYGFSLPKNSELLNEINPILLQEIESMNWKITLTEYGLGDN